MAVHLMAHKLMDCRVKRIKHLKKRCFKIKKKGKIQKANHISIDTTLLRVIPEQSEGTAPDVWLYLPDDSEAVRAAEGMRGHAVCVPVPHDASARECGPTVSHYVPISLDYLLIAEHQLVSLSLTVAALCLTFRLPGQPPRAPSRGRNNDGISSTGMGKHGQHGSVLDPQEYTAKTNTFSVMSLDVALASLKDAAVFLCYTVSHHECKFH